MQYLDNYNIVMNLLTSIFVQYHLKLNIFPTKLYFNFEQFNLATYDIFHISDVFHTRTKLPPNEIV